MTAPAGGPSSGSTDIDASSGATATFAGKDDKVTLKLVVARSTEEKARGLMYTEELPPDTGMIFVYESPVTTAFWMKNTYIPLSIAFISAEMRIIDIQDMEPLSLDPHAPASPYIYAIEVNQGLFVKNGIAVGSIVELEGV